MDKQPGLIVAGVSGTVLDDLSGTYKTFAEAVKEAISNAYDADATQVILRFGPEFSSLEIVDNGAGMNPRQFLREYVRVGRSTDAKKYSPSGLRERIGGKGIGALAPARYCRQLTIRTKASMPIRETVEVMEPKDGQVYLSSIFPYAPWSSDLVGLFSEFTCDGKPIQAAEIMKLTGPTTISYTFDAHKIWLEATIDFNRLRQLGETVNLEAVADLWNIRLVPAEPRDYGTSGTTLTLRGLEDFVTGDLRALGKGKARNVSSRSGLERFTWTLGKLCPVPVRNVKGELNAVLPPDAVNILQQGDFLTVFVVPPGAPLNTVPLTREVYLPASPALGVDASLCRVIRETAPFLSISIKGYLLGSPTIIFPAELRGVSIRVKGVELGPPTLFGADALVSGPQHVAITNHITGELHIDGVDARRDILPGREGLYSESPVYQTIRRMLAGNGAQLGGLLKDLVDQILLRSESHASAQRLIKVMKGRRDAALDACQAIALLTEHDETMEERFTTDSGDMELCLAPDVEIRPEGKLAAFTVNVDQALKGEEYRIDYEDRRLFLSPNASFTAFHLGIGMSGIRLLLKHGGKSRKYCEVEAGYLYINWDHPVRSALGDAAYIKHCLGMIAAGIPQERLSTYMAVMQAN